MAVGSRRRVSTGCQVRFGARSSAPARELGPRELCASPGASSAKVTSCGFEDRYKLRLIIAVPTVRRLMQVVPTRQIDEITASSARASIQPCRSSPTWSSFGCSEAPEGRHASPASTGRPSPVLPTANGLAKKQNTGHVGLGGETLQLRLANEARYEPCPFGKKCLWWSVASSKGTAAGWHGWYCNERSGEKRS